MSDKPTVDLAALPARVIVDQVRAAGDRAMSNRIRSWLIDPEIEEAIFDFCEDARGSMQSRMFQAVGRGWGLSWRDGSYDDQQVLARLRRAVDHLEAALANTDDRDEWEKRAADVANQAFMAADPKRRLAEPAQQETER